MQSHAMLIDGELVQTSEQDDVINPALGEPFATCARGTTAHVDEAVAAAKRAFGTWRKDEAFRREKLAECAAAMQARANDIGALLSQEQGKPLGAAIGEVFGASIWFSYYAGLQIEPEVLQDDDEKRIEILRKPLGVVAAITPFNFPIILLNFKLGPALLAGNTVVAKPSPYTPLSTLLLAEILKDVLPPGVLNIVTGDVAVGEALLAHPDVRKVSFTGSIGIGKKIMQAAADDLKRVTLELGGNDAGIVLDDADPKAIADGLFWGAFQNSGQVCMAIKRLYVPEKLHDPIVSALADRCASVKMGNGMEEGTELGPLNNRPQFEKVIAMVEAARKDGAKVVVGGAPLDRPGYFYPPTLVTGARRGMELVDEEQFGTALPVIAYRDLEEAIEAANGTHYGLASSVWSGDAARGAEVARQLEAGTNWVNHHMDITPAAPVGGCKWSGVGRESGLAGYLDFTEMQVLNVKK